MRRIVCFLMSITVLYPLFLSAQEKSPPNSARVADSVEYTPRYRQPRGVQKVVVYVGMTNCGASRDPELKAAIRKMKPLLARNAGAFGQPLSIVGVSLDWQVDSAFSYLKGLGAWDEMVLGNNWVNLGAERHIWRDATGLPKIPQVILYERTIAVGDRITFGADRELARYYGTDEILKWVEEGAPLSVRRVGSTSKPPAN